MTIDDILERLQEIKRQRGGWNMPVSINQEEDFTIHVCDGTVEFEQTPAKPEQLKDIKDLCQDIEWKLDEIRDVVKALEGEE